MDESIPVETGAPFGDQAMANLRVTPAQESLDMGTVAAMSHQDAAGLGTESGRGIRLETGDGRVAFATADLGQNVESGSIAIGTMLRRSLRARSHAIVSVTNAELTECTEVALIPWIDTTSFRGLHAQLESELADKGSVVSPGMLIYATLPDSAAGAWYTVASVTPGTAAFVGPSTRVRFEQDPRSLEKALAPGFDDVGGLDETIALVRELVELPLLHPHIYHHLGIAAPRGIIFHGPPGTGKTHLARAMANELDARFFYVEGPAVVGSFHGETEGNLRQLFSEAAHEAPSVILVDELDALLPRRDQSGTLSDTRMVTQLLALMDGLNGVDRVIVVGTTNRIDSIDPAARRPGRFDREVYFPPPGKSHRLEILQIQTRDMPLTIESHSYLDTVADRTDGFVGSDLLELVRVAGLHALRRVVGQSDPRRRLDSKAIENRLGDVVIGPKDFEAAFRDVRPSLLREIPVEIPATQWEEIGGLGEIKETLRQYVEKPLREGYDLSYLPRGIVLYGPPGTGKTLLVKALASSADVNLVVIQGVKVFSRWLGESEDAIHRAFMTARQVAPCIVFLEQLDALAPQRQSGEAARAAERVVAQLQVELDGLARLDDVFVIAETNRLESVDTSILRAGRLGVHLSVGLPTPQDRKEIIRIASNEVGLAGEFDPETENRFVEMTEGFSGADIAQALREVALIDSTSDRSAEDMIVSAVERRRMALDALGRQL